MRHKEFGRLAIFALQIEIMFILFISTCSHCLFCDPFYAQVIFLIYDAMK